MGVNKSVLHTPEAIMHDDMKRLECWVSYPIVKLCSFPVLGTNPTSQDNCSYAFIWNGISREGLFESFSLIHVDVG